MSFQKPTQGRLGPTVVFIDRLVDLLISMKRSTEIQVTGSDLAVPSSARYLHHGRL